MTTKLNNQFYFVAPLEVVKVTKDNLKEAAEWCGGKVATVESRKVPGRIDSYVWVPTPKGTQISWAFPGMFITRRIVVTLKNEITYTFQVYRRDYFEKNYFSLPNEAVDKTWERAAKARHPKTMQQISGQHTKAEEILENGSPDDAVSVGEAVALLESELGAEVIAQDAPPVPVEDLRTPNDPAPALPKPDHADGTGSVTNHVSAMVAANEEAAEQGA